MMDFWTVIGNLTMDPAFANSVLAQTPASTPISRVVYTGLPDGTTISELRQGAVYLDEAATASLRGVLTGYLYTRYGGYIAPVVSLYTAGKLCQQITTFTGLGAALTQAQTVVRDALGMAVPASTRFAALLGACFIDDRLSEAVKLNQDLDLVKEFGGIDLTDTSSQDTSAILAVVNHPQFQSAQTALLASPSWTSHCGEKLLWYEPFKDAAN